MRKADFRPETLDKRLEQIEWLITQYVKRASILLDVSRVTSGKFRLDPAPTNVSNLIREVVENFGLVAELAGSSLTCRFTDGDIHRVCDRLALEQILDNLVSNAIKYGVGQPILVSATEDAASGSVIVQVQDQGPGISTENQTRIFERFERVVHPGQHAGGFGVGLWVVGQLVETMGGSITIASQPDKGSTFTVSLPLPTLKELE
jgi:two-component system OmpR family sensor kinase